MTGPGLVFLMVIGGCAVAGLVPVVPSSRHSQEPSGVATNEWLSAVSGALLLLLTGAIGVTILLIGNLLPEHYLVGFLMLGPLGLKLGSTGYRFIRYYAGDPLYRQAGPPQILLRLTAPILVLATIAVFGTGIELWLFGSRFGTWWFQAHVVSFLFWTGSLAVHLLGHTRRSVVAGARDIVPSGSSSALGAGALVLASVVLGAVLAAASLLYASPFSSGFGSG